MERPPSDVDAVRRGRPREGRPVHVRIPDDDIEIIDRLAEHDSVTRAHVIRRLIAEGLASERPLS